MMGLDAILPILRGAAGNVAGRLTACEAVMLTTEQVSAHWRQSLARLPCAGFAILLSVLGADGPVSAQSLTQALVDAYRTNPQLLPNAPCCGQPTSRCRRRWRIGVRPWISPAQSARRSRRKPNARCRPPTRIRRHR